MKNKELLQTELIHILINPLIYPYINTVQFRSHCISH